MTKLMYIKQQTPSTTSTTSMNSSSSTLQQSEENDSSTTRTTTTTTAVQSHMGNNENKMKITTAPSHNTKDKKKVQFQTIEIREYQIILSDQAIPSNGVPIGISWAYQRDSVIVMNINDHEQQQQQQREQQQQKQRRGEKELRLTPDERMDILLSQGYSMGQILSKSRECQQIRSNRRESNRPRRKMRKVSSLLPRVKSLFRKVFATQKKYILFFLSKTSA